MPISLGTLRRWMVRSRAAPPWTGARLHQRYGLILLRYTTARLGPGPEAEDAAAEAFAAALARLDSCPADVGEGAIEDPTRAWLLGIARRKVADSLRRRTRSQRESPLLETLPAPSAQHPESQVLAEEAAQTLRTILASLPADWREALLLKYVDGLSLVELGQVMGRSPRAASQLLYRAREAARRHGAEYFTTEERQ